MATPSTVAHPVTEELLQAIAADDRLVEDVYLHPDGQWYSLPHGQPWKLSHKAYWILGRRPIHLHPDGSVAIGNGDRPFRVVGITRADGTRVADVEWV